MCGLSYLVSCSWIQIQIGREKAVQCQEKVYDLNEKKVVVTHYVEQSVASDTRLPQFESSHR